jgi:hypothetical protein
MKKESTARRFEAICAVMCLAVAGGCYESDTSDLRPEAGTGTDSDTDTDADTDVDSETDVDSDTVVDSDTDVDIDSDSDADADTDTGTDDTPGCGGAGEPCCDEAFCDFDTLVCVMTGGPDGQILCTALCEAHPCDAEGMPDVPCGAAAPGTDLGFCVNSDTEEPLVEDNACEGEGAFGSYCCPVSLGGDGLGDAPDHVCNDVDLTGLEPPGSTEDVLESGVGTCFDFWGEGVEFCLIPCGYENSCADTAHTCAPLSGVDLAACIPNEYL